MQPVMQAVGISKRYPGTLALNEVNFDIYPGKVNVLIGENGAGKSTLMKILAGIEKPTGGKVLLDGKEVHFQNTRDASAAGVGIIHQELNLFPEMKVVDNMFAGKELKRHGMIDRREQVRRAANILDQLQPGIDPGDLMLNLRVGQQQIVEIAKTMLHDQLKVLIMDEPTSSLSNAEVEVLFELIEDLKKRGIAIIYISHRLEEIIRVGDYVTILRDGRWVANAEVKDISVSWIVEKMVGHANLTIEKVPYAGERREIMQVKDYCLPRLGGGYTVDHVSFTLNQGEVLGIYGLMGAGRTELVESLMGLHAEATGTIVIGEETITRPNVTDQIARGMVLVPEDRQKDGLVQTMSISDNLLLTSIGHFTRNGMIDRRRCREAVKKTVADMQVKVADVRHLITSLSGGNQQKVVIAKWLVRNCDILIFDEPTRGIDVGAKSEIYKLMNQLAAEGKSIIMISSEMPELLRMSDRVLVMCEGKMTGEIDISEATQEGIMKYATQRS